MYLPHTYLIIFQSPDTTEKGEEEPAVYKIETTYSSHYSTAYYPQYDHRYIQARCILLDFTIPRFLVGTGSAVGTVRYLPK